MLTNLARISVLVVGLCFAVAGCGDDSSMMSGGQDLAVTTGGDMSHAAGDMAKAAGDDGGTSLLALCQTCTSNADCASGLCQTYGMGGNTTMKCSHSCSASSASTDCPGVNACNNKGVCLCP